jgi:hypothetical protein
MSTVELGSADEFIQKNELGLCQGNAIKYLCRWKAENGIQDLQKAIIYIELLIEMEASGRNFN